MSKLDLNFSKYDFLDFGCSRGDSIIHAKKLFGENLKGLGIDIDEDKLVQARERGFEVLNLDILTLAGKRNIVDFVLMIHFLEHVPDYNVVKKYMKIGCELAKKFVLVRQPYFDADGFLFEKGLKLFWSDWVGHPNRMTSLEMYNSLRTLVEKGIIEEFSIHVKGKISSSDNKKILSFLEPEDSFEFTPGKLPKDSDIVLNDGVYSELVAIALKNHDPEFHRTLVKKVKVDKTLFRTHKW